MAVGPVRSHELVHPTPLRDDRLRLRVGQRAGRLSQPRDHAATRTAHGSPDFACDLYPCVRITGWDLRLGLESGARPWRGDRLARLPGARAVQNHGIYRHSFAQWGGVVMLALPSADLGRLQRWNTDVVRPYVFYP